MAKPSISIGDNDTGPPANAPDGPYTTDRTDDTRKRQPPRAAPARTGTQPPSHAADDEDLASRRKGPAQP
jgi:hypothetical protein